MTANGKPQARYVGIDDWHGGMVVPPLLTPATLVSALKPLNPFGPNASPMPPE